MPEKNKKEVLKKAVASAKMYDVGHKMSDMPLMKPMKKNEKCYPYMNLSAKEAPFLENCTVGEDEKFVIEATLTSKDVWQDNKGMDRANYTFEIKKVGLSK